ncbi:MAG: preprotein translocase subunit SecA [Phycisphaerae bacterium]
MALESVAELVSTLARKVFGSRNERLIRAYMERVAAINALEPEMHGLSDEALRGKTDEFRRRYRDGETLDDLLPEAFAVAREAAARTVWLGAEQWGQILAEAQWVRKAGGGPGKEKAAPRKEPDGGQVPDRAGVERIERLLKEANRPDPFGLGVEAWGRILAEVLSARHYMDYLPQAPGVLDAYDDERAYVLAEAERRPRLYDARREEVPDAVIDRLLERKRPAEWVGYGEAPAGYHPEVRERVRQAMRGEASLLDPDTGEPIERFGLYSMRPYDVQLVAAMVLHEGRIAELVTGEGKTLVATLAVYLNALAGRAVHVVSVNDFLVRRDCEWMRPVFRKLGLSVGAIQSDMDHVDRRIRYACDITYGTNNEFGFDYLRDNMKTRLAEQVQGPLAYAIVDECDSVLIDEARTPLIISGPAFESTDKYAKAGAVAKQLRPGRDFEIKEKEHQCPLTEEGVSRAEELVGVGSFYVAGNMDWPHLIDQALRAHHLYKRDKNYVVRGGNVVIVDEFTGRLMPGRQWSDGLHQAVEAKEGITIKEETQTLATITLQNYFRMYDKLAGMTGTAMTEAAEFDKIYGLETVAVPTNRPLSRTEHTDVIFRTQKEKYQAIVEEIKAYHEAGRPVLVGTTSVESSEHLSKMLERTYGIPHEVLNAKYHEKESQIVAKAGRRHVGPDGKPKGNVTIATEMAGRGTDIKLGEGVVYSNCFGPWDVEKQQIPSDFGFKCCVGCPEYDPKTNCGHCFKPKVDPAFPKRGKTECVENPPCGLHVVGTERHEARRVDNQLRGRTGRQGDPGSSRFYLAFEDDLLRIFARDWVSGALEKLGMEEGMALEHKWLTRGIENAQKKVEQRNFDIRKHLLEYDEVMDHQRKIFYGRRQHVLEADDLRDFVWDLLAESVEAACDSYLSEDYSLQTVAEWAGRTLGAQVDASQLQVKDPGEAADFLKAQARQAAGETIGQTLGEFVPEEFDYPEEADEPPPEPDYRGLAEWARSVLDVDVKEPDLKGAAPDEIAERLAREAEARIDAVDTSPVARMMQKAFRLEALADWANTKFEMGLAASDLAGLDRDAAEEMILSRLREFYAAKERSYPVEFAIEEYLSPQVGHGADDFEGLAEWASRFYLTDVSADDLRDRDPLVVRERLLEIAREFEASDRLRRTVEDGVAAHMPAGDLEDEASWQALARWAADTLALEITPRQLADAAGETRTPEAAGDGDGEAVPAEPRDAVAAMLAARARAERRTRMTELERYILLQVHDTSWKDHLLVMDHLKSSVGLRSFAQKNPLIEYKKEGLESFERMLESAREKFTDLFFKARWVRQDALARIWAGQESRHAVAESAYEAQRQAALRMSQQSQMADEGREAVKTIVRDQPKVGRNDPCPCGSGKKYKKCCGRRT